MRTLAYIIFVALFLLSFLGTGEKFARSEDMAATKPQKPSSETPRVEATQKIGEVELTLSAPETLKSGKENLISITIHNDGDPVQYVDNPPLQGIKFDVKRDGQIVPPMQLYRSWTSNEIIRNRSATPKLTKGDDLQLVLNITRLFDLSLPGKYEIAASWSGKAASAKKWSTIKTDPIKINVVVEEPALTKGK